MVNHRTRSSSLDLIKELCSAEVENVLDCPARTTAILNASSILDDPDLSSESVTLSVFLTYFGSLSH